MFDFAPLISCFLCRNYVNFLKYPDSAVYGMLLLSYFKKKKKNLNTELFMQIKSWYINLFFSRHIWRNFEAILTIILIVLQVAVVSNNLQHVSYRIYIVHQYKWHMYITYMYNIHKNIYSPSFYLIYNFSPTSIWINSFDYIILHLRREKKGKKGVFIQNKSGISQSVTTFTRQHKINP